MQARENKIVALSPERKLHSWLISGPKSLFTLASKALLRFTYGVFRVNERCVMASKVMQLRESLLYREKSKDTR